MLDGLGCGCWAALLLKEAIFEGVMQLIPSPLGD